MPAILILRHNSFLLTVNQKLVTNLLVSQTIEAEIIAPKEFIALTIASGDASRTKLMSTLVRLAQKWPSNVDVIFFEANLGFPGHEDLNETTVKMLEFLIDNYPEALFLLKSHTEQAIINAAKLLKNKGVPVERIISSGSIDAFTDEMKELICDKLTERVAPRP